MPGYSNECNRKLAPIFKEIGKKARELYSMDPKSPEYKEKDKNLDKLYKNACGVFRKYNPSYRSEYVNMLN